jgi:hypothetical protein
VLANGACDYSDIAEHASQLTHRMRGDCPIKKSSWTQYVSRLVTRGLAIRSAHRPFIWAATEAAIASRQKVCPIIAVRGEELTRRATVGIIHRGRSSVMSRRIQGAA